MSIADQPFTKLRSEIENRVNAEPYLCDKRLIIIQTLQSVVEWQSEGNELTMGNVSDIRMSILIDKEKE